MQTEQKRFWFSQVSALLLAGLIALTFWMNTSDWRVFYFPELSCGVCFCTVEDTFLPFLGQFFLLAALLLYLLILFSLEKFSAGQKKILRQKSYPPWLVGIVAIVFLSAGWEGISRARFFLKVDLPLFGESCAAQYKNEYPDAYQYAEAVKAHLPERYAEAQLISDIDFSDGPGMRIHRSLAYFLYPINIRFHLSERYPEVLLFFRKDNALSHVPPGYRVAAIFGPANLVAVRQ